MIEKTEMNTSMKIVGVFDEILIHKCFNTRLYFIRKMIFEETINEDPWFQIFTTNHKVNEWNVINRKEGNDKNRQIIYLNKTESNNTYIHPFILLFMLLLHSI